jgi:hypothetical protein
MSQTPPKKSTNTPNGPNASSPSEQKSENVEQSFDPKDMQASYLERALYSYLRKAIIGGIEVLKTKPYRLFFWYVVCFVVGSTVTGLLMYFNLFITPEIFETVLFWGFLSGVALILGALLGAIWKKDGAWDTFSILLLVVAGVVAWLWPHLQDNLILEWTKMVLYFAYTFFCAFSIFYILIFYQTSLYSRLVTIGISPNRLFFQEFLRLAAWIIVGVSIYLALQPNRSGFFIGIVTFLFGWVLLVLLYNIPMLPKETNEMQRDWHNAMMNFRQVLGFYAFYMIYHLALSINSESNLGNFLMEILLLMVNAFFIINSLARKVEGIKDLDKEMSSHFRFQLLGLFDMRLKKALGMKTLILVCLGLALSYFTALLGSTANVEKLILLEVVDTELSISTFYHRSVLVFCILMAFSAYIWFQTSAGYRDVYVNRYSIRHAWGMFADLFKRGEDGKPSVVEDAIRTKAGQVLKAGEKLRNDFLGLFKKKSNASGTNYPPDPNSTE